MVDAAAARGTRRRSMALLFGGVALTKTAQVGASTMATLVAAASLGPALSGIPNAAGVLGTATGTVSLSRMIARHGARVGLMIGYLVTALGAVVATVGVTVAAPTALVAGMFGIGIGNGGAQLSRYAAAELYPVRNRGAAIGALVWAGTVGALLGPNLIGVTAHAAPGIGMPGHAGPYLLSLLAACGAVALSSLIPRLRGGASTARTAERGAVRRALRLPHVSVALAAMIAGQLTMVAVMTMTPVHMRASGQGLTVIGAVIAVHMVGMFALAPFSGWLAGRFGGVRTILAGFATLLVSTICTVLAPGSGALLFAGLFLLGYGWNLTFVGGSSLISSGLPDATRTRLQGSVDGMVWGSSAVASVGSGFLVAGLGYAPLAAIALATVVIPIALVIRHRSAFSAPPASGVEVGPETPDAGRVPR